MKILFLTLGRIITLEDRGIYTDLLRKFRDEGHRVYVISPIERRECKPTILIKEKGTVILNLRTLNIQKANVLEKGIGTLVIEYQFLNAVKNYFKYIKFDLVLYSTPPITFSKVIEFVKKRDGASSYLLLKDIFPQNAVDMGMIKEGGLLYKLFKKKEQKLYEASDVIGCMSEANKEYLLRHNKYLDKDKVEVNPNSIEPKEFNISEDEKTAIRMKYGLPREKKIFIYGGNLGKPQGIDFLLETIQAVTREDVYFLIVGSGTEYKKINSWFEKNNPKNAKLLKELPKIDYDTLLSACQIGLIFLHKDFTIPNFPSRLLSYLEMGMPVLAATDLNTDIGSIIQENGCGFWVLSGDHANMITAIERLCDMNEVSLMKHNAKELLCKSYNVSYSYDLIKRRYDSNKLR